MLLDASVQGDCGPVKDKFRRITLSAGMMVKLQRTKVKRRVQTSPPPLQNVEFHQRFNYTAVFRVFLNANDVFLNANDWKSSPYHQHVWDQKIISGENFLSPVQR